MKLNLSFGLKAKLLTALALVSIAIGGLAYYSIKTIGSLSSDVELLGKDRLALTETLGNMRATMHAIPRYAWLALNLPSGHPERPKALANLEKQMVLLSDNIKEYSKYNLTPEGKAKVTTLNEQLPQLLAAVKAGHDLIAQDTEAANKEARTLLITKMPPVAIPMTAVLQEITDIAKNRNAAIVSEAVVHAEKAQTSLIFTAISVSLAVLITGIFFAFRLSKQLLRITTSVSDASQQVAAASTQLSNAAEMLSSSSQQQASSIEETSASLTEITGMVEANVKDAERANEVARSVEATSESTRKTMEDLNNAMSSILDSNRRIEALVKVIEEIGEKTDIIDEIVFKTQLLSFNASVEAERAGEHGRGFAVVAQEVGNLAQMSGKAATEIASIVKSSIKEAEEVARENKSRVENGGRLAVESKEKLANSLMQLRVILEGTHKIVAASKEQSQGINQISTAVDSLNQTTQETAGTAEESASASAELAGQAESLLALVNDLATIVTGTALNAESHRHHAEPAPVAKKGPKMKTAKVIAFDQNRKRKVQPVAEPARKTASGEEYKPEPDSALPDTTDSGDDGWERL